MVIRMTRLVDRLELESAVVAAAREWAKPLSFYDDEGKPRSWAGKAQKIESVLITAVEKLEVYIDHYGE